MIVFIIIAIVVAIVLRFLYKKQHRFSYNNKHVVVVGGSSGIGKEFVYQILKENPSIISVVSSNLKKLESVIADEPSGSDELRSKIKIYQCDITNKDLVKSTLENIISENGDIHSLVNCAGLSVPGYFIEQELDIFEKTMKLDYFGTLYATKQVVSHMIEREIKGYIVFVSSTLGMVSISGYSTYSPAKFAIVGLAQTLRSELKPYGIRFSVVYPPDTDTPGYEQENLTKPEETRIISGGGKAVRAIDVAKVMVNGIKAGEYHIAYDLGTKLICVLAPGFTPFYYSVFDILLAPIVRIIGFIVMNQNDSEVFKAFKKKPKQNIKNTISPLGQSDESTTIPTNTGSKKRNSKN